MGKSAELDGLPDRPGHVRASINGILSFFKISLVFFSPRVTIMYFTASGYVYRAVEGDPSKCFVQYIVNVDPKVSFLFSRLTAFLFLFFLFVFLFLGTGLITRVTREMV